MTLPIETIKFDSDTAERKKLFTAASFSHPAKMHLSLQVYLVERYTKPGDTILDPMGGSGTLLIGCTLGRNVVLVELEHKFCKMMVQNWLKIKSLGPMLGYKMGEATILQGDARNLDGLLADNILFSPPYAEAIGRDSKYYEKIDTANKKRAMEMYGKQLPSYTANLKYSYVKDNAGKSPHNIGNLPYGAIDAVISSPSYAGTEAQVSADKFADPEKFAEISSERFRQGKKKGHFASKEAILRGMEKTQKGCGENPNNISKLPYKADAVITSPPYEKAIGTQGGETREDLKGYMGKSCAEARNYSKSQDNIGNLKSENYLQAMLSVYQNCHSVLKEKGLMILVVKNFIRDKKIVRLDLDTIKICESAGFTLKERLQRKLTSQSFWRIIYHNKFPDVEKIEYEDVLVFQRQKGL